MQTGGWTLEGAILIQQRHNSTRATQDIQTRITLLCMVEELLCRPEAGREKAPFLFNNDLSMCFICVTFLLSAGGYLALLLAVSLTLLLSFSLALLLSGFPALLLSSFLALLLSCSRAHLLFPFSDPLAFVFSCSLVHI